MKALAVLLAVLMLALTPGAAMAVLPGEVLANPALEARAEAIGRGLRCLVCQDESIEASSADLAHELRVLVREKLKEGDTDAQVRQYIVARYGEFVLLKPVFAWHTVLLWFAAPGLLLVGLAAMILAARRRQRTPAPDALTEDERRTLAALTGEGERAKSPVP